MSGVADSAMCYVDLGDVSSRMSELPAAAYESLEIINQKVAAHESVDDMLRFVFASTADISPCDRISLALLADNGRRVISHLTIADYEPVLLKKGYAEDLHGSSLRQVLERRTPRLINDLEEYLVRNRDSVSTRLLLREGVRSSMTCPLVVDDRVVGLLFRSCRRPNAYDERQVLYHQVIAERLSQAVEKVLRIEQLAAANRDYFNMLGFVTHELKSPVASLVTDAQLLRDGYVGKLDGKQRERISKIIDKGDYLLGLVQEYLDLAKVEGGEMRPKVESVDVMARVIAPSVDLIQSQIDAKGMQLSLPASATPPQAELDPNLLKIVVVNLLSNAVKYGSKGGRIRLAIVAESNRFMLSVWNEGQGFPSSEQGRLFHKFSRLNTPNSTAQKGSGIGLYTSWRIVHAHGGRIWASSEEGAWAEFSFEIPQPPQEPAVFDGAMQ